MGRTGHRAITSHPPTPRVDVVYDRNRRWLVFPLASTSALPSSALVPVRRLARAAFEEVSTGQIHTRSLRPDSEDKIGCATAARSTTCSSSRHASGSLTTTYYFSIAAEARWRHHYRLDVSSAYGTINSALCLHRLASAARSLTYFGTPARSQEAPFHACPVLNAVFAEVLA